MSQGRKANQSTKRHVRKGDLVQVITGKYKGRQGRIIEVLVKKDRVRVEGVATVKKHIKANKDPKNPKGGIVQMLGSVHISNVMLVDPQSNKPTRVGMKFLENGQKVRVSKRSGEELHTA